MIACQEGHTETARAVMDRGADINAKEVSDVCVCVFVQYCVPLCVFVIDSKM